MPLFGCLESNSLVIFLITSTFIYVHFLPFENCYLSEANSFTGKFEIKTTERNTICLENATWKSAIDIELIFSDTSKLHINFIVIIFIYQLKVLHTRFIYSTIEIKYESLNLFIPFWWLIEKEHYIRCFVISELPLDSVLFNFGIKPLHFFAFAANHREQYLHSSWSF